MRCCASPLAVWILEFGGVNGGSCSARCSAAREVFVAHRRLDRCTCSPARKTSLAANVPTAVVRTRFGAHLLQVHPLPSGLSVQIDLVLPRLSDQRRVFTVVQHSTESAKTLTIYT